MIIYLALLCNFFSFIVCMETEQKTDLDSLQNETFIETHFLGNVINPSQIFKDLPLIIAQAPSNKKALSVLIGYYATVRYMFDSSFYQTSSTRTLLTSLDWHKFPLDELQQEPPQTCQEKFYHGILYHSSTFKKYRIPKKNSRKYGIQLLRESALGNFPKAMHYLGCIARLEKNKTDAHDWQLKGSELSYAPSLFERGHMMLKNTPDSTTMEQAITFLEKSAQSNYSTAHYYLGLLYDNKTHIKNFIHTDKAIEHYKKAAKLGCLQAWLNLGLLYLKKNEKNYNALKGLCSINKAAQLGYSPALVLISRYYCFGMFINQDIQEGLKLLHEAAQQDDSDAYYHLAMIYILGEITQQDIPKGIDFLKKSANDNNRCAQYQLGMFFLNAIHVEHDIDKGIELLTQSTKKKYCKAQYELGRLYNEGKLVKQNIPYGIKLLHAAAHQNYPKAREYLTQLEMI